MFAAAIACAVSSFLYFVSRYGVLFFVRYRFEDRHCWQDGWEAIMISNEAIGLYLSLYEGLRVVRRVGVLPGRFPPTRGARQNGASNVLDVVGAGACAPPALSDFLM